MTELSHFSERGPEHNWNEKQQALLNAVLEAHAKSAERNSISTNVMLNVGRGSGSYTNAIAAAILSLGDAHAPLKDAMRVLSTKETPWGAAATRVPGWGNSFIKGHDPVWEEARNQLAEGWPEIADTINRVTEMLHTNGKDIYPNPACYTAACAIILNIPKEVAAWIFIEGRLRAWTDAFLKQQKHGS